LTEGRARAGALALVATSVAALLLPAGIEFAPRFVWNASASVPVGLYRRVDGDPARGDLVLVRPPEAVLRLATERGYLPADVPLIKQVAGFPGERVCRIGARVLVEGKQVATALEADGLGRPLPAWHGCRRLLPGELFLLNAHPASLDGRYFGPVGRAAVLGRLVPVWVRSGLERSRRSPGAGPERSRIQGRRLGRYRGCDSVRRVRKAGLTNSFSRPILRSSRIPISASFFR